MPRSPTARDLAAQLLLDEDRGRGWVRDLLPKARSRLVDGRDRGLLTELAYGTVRHRGTLDQILAPHSRWPVSRLGAPVRTALRLALYQFLFLDRVPDHALFHHAVDWARRRSGAKPSGYVNAVLRAVQKAVEGPAMGPEDPRRDVPREDGSAIRFRQPVFPDPETDPVAHLAARFSCAPWLVERWIEARGLDRAQALLQVGIMRPPLTLRARGDRDALVQRLCAEGADAVPGPVEAAVLVRGAGESAALDAVERGEAWVQDATAQRVAPLLAPRPGQHLLDLCAAPGGKTIHLADLLGRGEVIACDVDDEKVKAMSSLLRFVPSEVTLRTGLIPATGPLPFQPASFDGILIDAPCTNTGVLRRRVEVRWRLEPKDVGSLAAIQRDLLERSLPLLRSGGALLYTTCSVEPEENGDLVNAFLAAHPRLKLEQMLEVPPSRDADGGFAALMRRG